MTDKNLADECERLANKLAALIEASPGPGTLLEAMNALDRAAAAIRAIARELPPTQAARLLKAAGIERKRK